MVEVVCMGAINVDLMARVEEFPRPDEEAAVGELRVTGGGSAANVAVGICRLGHTAGFVGWVGDDPWGRMLEAELRSEGVDVSWLRRRPGASGLVFAAVNARGQRVLFAFGGVAREFRSSELPLEYLRSGRFLHLTSIASEQAVEAFALAAREASRAGVEVSLDPGCILARMGMQALGRILPHCSLFLPNEVEARLLTGDDGEDAARSFLEAGCRAVIITRGARGCLVATGEGTWQLAAPAARVVDTTGAGDAFAAGLLVALLEGRPLLEAAGFAQHIAAEAIAQLGARSVPRRPA